MLFSKQIAQLTAQLAAAEEKLSTIEAAHTAAIEALKAEHSTALDALKADHTTALDALKASHTAEITSLKEGMETKIQEQVVQRCAAAGLDSPIARDADAAKPDVKPGDGANKLTGMAKAVAALKAKHEQGYAKA